MELTADVGQGIHQAIGGRCPGLSQPTGRFPEPGTKLDEALGQRGKITSNFVDVCVHPGGQMAAPILGFLAPASQTNATGGWQPDRGVAGAARVRRVVGARAGTRAVRLEAVRDRIALPLIGALSLVVVLVVGVLLLGHTPGRGGRADVAVLPTLNAFLNGASAVLLLAGWRCIRQRRIAAHRACMLGAFCVSVLFFVSYVTYHALTGSQPFAGSGWIRWLYFPVLVSHIVLAAAMVPLVLTTLYRALSADFARHARLARFTLPVWIYVSITGVVVYLMLYHLPGGR